MSRLILLTCGLAAALLTAGSLTGCSVGSLPGSSSSLGAVSGGGPASGAASPPPRAGGGSGSAGTGFTPPTTCLSAAVVSGILSVPAHGPTVSANSTSLVCSYETATQDGPIIDIEPSGKITAAAFEAELKSGAKSGTSVNILSGVGDSAAVLTEADGGRVIVVLSGSYTLNIAGGPVTPASLITLAKKVLAN